MAPNNRRMDPTLPLDPSMEAELAQLEAQPDNPSGITDLEEQRLLEEMLSNMDSLLPNVKLQGYHTCWLSSTSERDPISQRERWGYMPVTRNEVAGLRGVPPDIHTAQPADDYIRVREMILYKIPLPRAEAIYRINHHLRPAQMVEALDPRRSVNLQSMRDRSGTPLVTTVGDGVGPDFLAPRAVPRFFPLT